MPDGTLLHLRDTYPTETAWAPQYVGDELRQVRAGAHEAALTAARASAEAAAAERSGRNEAAARHRVLAASYRGLRDAYRQRESVFAGVMADRAGWEAATRAQRHLAVAADAELRRRHPEQRYTPLRSAEPQATTDAQCAELTLTAGQDIPEAGQWIKDLAARRRTFAAKLADRQSLMVPSETPAAATSARRSRPGPDLARMRSCSHPSRRSAPRPGSWSAPWTATPTWKREIDSSPVHPGSGEVTAMAAIGITGMGLTGVVRMNWVREELWDKVRAGWSRAWSANYAALEFLQDTGLSRFSPVKPQRWLAASFEHHYGPHGLPRPHIHNIVIVALTKGE